MGMLLNQTHPSVSPTSRAFLNKSKTSFDIASLVSSEAEELSKDMSPLNMSSPDERIKKEKRNKFTFDERWHPYKDASHHCTEEAKVNEYHIHKKYYRHQRSKDDPSLSPISPNLESPRLEKTENKSPVPFSQQNLANIPTSSFQTYIPDSQLLKAMAAGVLQFPFPRFGQIPPSMHPLTSLPSTQDTESPVFTSDTVPSPSKPSPVRNTPLNPSENATKTSTSPNSRSSVSPKMQSSQSPDFSTNQNVTSAQSPLLSTGTNPELDCYSRQALLQAAATTPGFPPTSPISGLPNPFVPPCFPRLPTTQSVGSSAFDPASNMALGNPFCPPHSPAAGYNPWLLRQAAAAASVRPFPPHLAGELVMVCVVCDKISVKR